MNDTRCGCDALGQPPGIASQPSANREPQPPPPGSGNGDLATALLRQTILTDILALGVRDQPAREFLGEALRLVLSLPGLSLRPMGCVFLADEAGTELRMAAQLNMSIAVQESCARVPFGTCLCGRAAATRAAVIASEVDELHSIRYEGISPHGHYCVPLCASGKTLGLLCLYTDAGRPRDPEEAAVVNAAAGALAGLILRDRLTRELRISRASFMDLVRDAPMVVLIVDDNNIIQFANRSLEEFVGLPPGQAVGTRPDDYLEWRGDEAVLVRGARAPTLFRVVRSQLSWGDRPSAMIVLDDISAERALEKVRRTLVGAHYPNIARRVIERGAARYLPEERSVSVLFFDMKDSTQVANQRGKAYLAKLLDHLYRLAINAVDATGGSINNLIGDAVMATFNAPLDLPDHVWQAVEAGARFVDLAAAFRKDNPDAPFDIHIGIETGPALVGDVGPEERHLYTVTGGCVQLASRLTKLPLENRVVVGPGVANALAGRRTFMPWGPVTLGGFEDIHNVYVVAGDAEAMPGRGPGNGQESADRGD